MKKFISPLPSGLMPVYKSDLVQIQDNAFDAIYSILKGVRCTTSFVVSGMDSTTAGPGLINISAGYWWRADTEELYKFNGASNVATPVTIVQGGVTTGTKVYKDGSTQNVTQDLLTQVQANTVISGNNSIVFNPDTTRRLYNMFAKRMADLLDFPWTLIAGASKTRYSRDSNGWVNVIGVMGTQGDANNLVLPAGFRPNVAQTFDVMWGDDANGGVVSIGVDTISVSTAGIINSTAITGAGTDRNSYFNFRFPTTIVF